MAILKGHRHVNEFVHENKDTSANPADEVRLPWTRPQFHCLSFEETTTTFNFGGTDLTIYQS